MVQVSKAYYIYTNNVFVSFIAELAFLVALYLKL